MKKILCIVLSVMMLFMLTACSGNNDEITAPDETAAQTGEESGLLSSFTAETLDGEKADESIFEGKKVTMVNIWATFCGPCIREMPDLQKLHEDYADKGFHVVGIVCDIYEYDGVFDESGLQTAKDIVKDTGVKYVSLLPSDDLNKAKLNSVTSVPETVFVDETGTVIAGPYIGSRSYDSWARIIEEVLNK